MSARLAQPGGADFDKANINIDKGVITTILNDRKQAQAAIDNANAEANKVKEDSLKDQATQAVAMARKKAARQFREQLDADGEVAKAWEGYAKNIAQYTNEYQNNIFKDGGMSAADSNNLSEQGKATSDWITSMREGINLRKQNSTSLAENSIQMAVATGQMTRLDAAQATANLHTQDYTDALALLKQQRDDINNSDQYGDANDPRRKAALQANQNQIDSLNGSRQIQIAQDNQRINPAGSSGLVGATDALNDFVIASRDAATQMRGPGTKTTAQRAKSAV